MSVDKAGYVAMDIRNAVSIQSIKDRLAKAVVHAQIAVARRIQSDSQAFVPVLTGRLKDSSSIQVLPTISKALSIVRVVYDTPYAERQHNVPYNHPSLGFFGAAKYLSAPLEQNSSYYQALFELEVERYLRFDGDA